MTHNQGRATHDSRRTSRVRHDAEATTKAQTCVTTSDIEQPCEKNVSPQARPPQTSTRSRAHKQKHPRPRTRHEVRETHSSVPPRTAPRNRLRKQ
ncbi:hypothetical protein Taro_044854 [Colocasia esculenta]|uniref:Uncharacterized protein n=1 Tax=Colocasia esculenta TaxID=4460 RepID=A0A843X3W8_COLES|nr:hypothetical protein [Colocasia esculenta]